MNLFVGGWLNPLYPPFGCCGIYSINNYIMGSKFFGNKNDNKNNKNHSSNKMKSNNNKKNGGSGIKKSGRGK